MRLIEKLSRPIPISTKEELVMNFKQKFITLHQLMDITLKETPKESESTYSRANKSLNSNKGMRQRTQRQDIRKIEAKYIEVLVDGSFKHYKRVAKLYGLPLNMDVINI